MKRKVLFLFFSFWASFCFLTNHANAGEGGSAKSTKADVFLTTKSKQLEVVEKQPGVKEKTGLVDLKRSREKGETEKGAGVFEKENEEKVVLKFKKAPLREVLNTLADVFGFYYVIQYPDFDSEVFADAKEVVFQPFAAVQPSQQEEVHSSARTEYGKSKSEEEEEDEDEEVSRVDPFNPGYSFENRKLTFYVSASKKEVKKVINLFCTVADVDCEYDGEKKLLKVNPYRVEIFDYGFFMNYSVGNSLGLGELSTGGSNVSVISGSSSTTTGTSSSGVSSTTTGEGTGFGIAESYKEFVYKVLAGLRSKEGRIFVSKRGYVVVVDRPSAVERIKKVWKKEVKKQEPVVLNVKVIRVDLTKNRETGIDWDGIINKIFGADATSFSFSTEFNLPKKGVTFTFDSSKLNFLFRALREYGDVKIVYDWTVKARNGIPVVFADIQSIPYITETVVVSGETTQTASTPEFVDVGLKITTVGSFTRKCRGKVCQRKYEGHAFISISDLVKIENLGTKDDPYYVPNVKFSSAAIPFDLKSNESIVITSFKTTRKERSQEGIPILMNIPLFGGLFKYSKDYSGVSEFVIIITPYFTAESYPQNGEPEVIYKKS